MKCLICHGGAIEPTNVEEELTVGNNIVKVPVRVLVYLSCSERYYDRKAVRYLEEVETRLKEGRGNLKEIGKVLAYE